MKHHYMIEEHEQQYVSLVLAATYTGMRLAILMRYLQHQNSKLLRRGNFFYARIEDINTVVRYSNSLRATLGLPLYKEVDHGMSEDAIERTHRRGFVTRVD